MNDQRSVVERLLNRTKGEKNGGHPGFPEHRQPHPLDLWIKFGYPS